MQTYYVNTVSSPSDIFLAHKAEISVFRNSDYNPKTYASVVFVPDAGFYVRMECFEANPKAIITEIDGDTYKDSCMECFLNFCPQASDYYINLEGNAIGTLHCKLGKDRDIRKPLSDYSVLMPEMTAEVGADSWAVNYFISLDLITSLFGKSSFSRGDIIKGNFYKCGDETESPHYGMWNEVKLEKLDFHRPDYFGDLVIA